MNIYIVGKGKLAQAIIEANIEIDYTEFKEWSSSAETSLSKSVLIHAGSGRQLNDCIEFCKETGSILIELSTGLETETIKAEFPIIMCPNTSILILKALNLIKKSKGMFDGFNITITESHQATKTTEPGTAFDFAHSLNTPTSKIESVRDVKIQRNEIGIPEEYLGRHAYHKIEITDDNDSFTLETKVLGHDSYAKGVEQIIKAVLKAQLENRVYSVDELIEKGYL